MTESRKIVLQETARIAMGHGVCLGIMLAVYAVIGKFSIPVLLGGLVGSLISTANYFLLALTATLAADRAEQQDPEGGKKLMQSSYPIRLLVLGGALVLCILSGWFDILALVVPMLFLRPVLMTLEFFGKKEG